MPEPLAFPDGTGRPEPRVFQVSELARRIKFLIEEDIGVAWIEGECSNVKANSASGHIYFTLKDEGAQIQCAFFTRYQRQSRAMPREGARVRVQGLVTAYEKSSQYQIVVHRVDDAGEGALRAAFERLKARLLAQGYFDAGRKRPLPLLPARIGIVTSPTGAAIRDMLTVLRRRFPDRFVRIVPVRVQGPGAGAEVAAAIDLLNEHALVDVMIIGRGGGSLEDLWAFNEECVAQAVYRSSIPVISAVGHETDFTISDFVADLRAPTPSAAAELVIGRQEDFLETTRTLARRLAGSVQSRALEIRNRLLHASRSPVLANPFTLVERPRRTVEALGAVLARRTTAIAQAQRLELERCQARLTRRLESAVRDRQRRLDDLQSRLPRLLEGAARQGERRLDELGGKLQPALRLHLQSRREHVRRLQAKLETLSPTAVLTRGFSITLGPDGKAVTAAGGLKSGDTLTTVLADGRVRSTVE